MSELAKTGRGAAPPAITRGQITAAVIGNALEFYDFTVYTVFAVDIGKAFFPTHDPFGSLMLSLATFGVGFITRPIGALVIGALAGFATTGKTWWLVPALLLLPDVAALGYLWNTRVGAHLYNLSHAAPVPVALAGIGIWQHESLVLAIALIWLAHIGMDRAMNYGLKYPDDSRHTHLGRHGH